jgi:hypothetical protein
MFEEACGQSSVQEKMRTLSYRMLYQNVRNRLCREAQILPFDFLGSHHDDGHLFIERYRTNPMLYICRQQIGFIGSCYVESRCVVVARGQRVVALRDPEQAAERQQSFLSVLEEGKFTPYLDCPIEFWNEHIEPTTRKTGNVLPGVHHHRGGSELFDGMMHTNIDVLNSQVLRLG